MPGEGLSPAQEDLSQAPVHPRRAPHSRERQRAGPPRRLPRCAAQLGAPPPPPPPFGAASRRAPLHCSRTPHCRPQACGGVLPQPVQSFACCDPHQFKVLNTSEIWT